MTDWLELHPRLAADTVEVLATPDYWLRWMNDRRFAWLVVVPRVAVVREWHELAPTEQQRLLMIVNRCAAWLQRQTSADKINIGALGNIVPQLHVHIIARHVDDACWPGPVWGQGTPQPWPEGGAPPWVPGLRDMLVESGDQDAS